MFMFEATLLIFACISLVVAISALLKLRHNAKSASNRIREERGYVKGEFLSPADVKPVGDWKERNHGGTKLHLAAHNGNLINPPV